MFYLPLYLLYSFAVSATVLRRETSTDVHLAIGPSCGNFGDISIGINALDDFNTIIAFGDSYTDAGNENGGSPPPATIVPPDVRAGGRQSNGPVWIEDLANAANASLKDYAVADALVDATQYPGVSLKNSRDFFNQIQMLISQPSSRFNPNTTLYTVFFGMGDFVQSKGFTTLDPNEVAAGIIYGILELASSPIFAKNILIVDNYGRGNTTEAGEDYKTALYTGINGLVTRYGLNIAFADFGNIWRGVLGSDPGYSAFGYTSPGACVSDNGAVCADPDHTFYWLPGLPSKVTHGIMSEYVNEVISQCQY